MPTPVAERSEAPHLLGLRVRILQSCLSLVSVVCYQVEVSTTGRSLIQRSPTNSGVSFCVILKPQEWGGPGLSWTVAPEEKENDWKLAADRDSISGKHDVLSYCRHHFHICQYPWVSYQLRSERGADRWHLSDAYVKVMWRNAFTLYAPAWRGKSNVKFFLGTGHEDPEGE